MIDAATRAGTPDGSAIDWVTADVATWQPDRPFDVVISRFGVMFFDDPAAAFANLARAHGRRRPAVRRRVGARGASTLFELPLRSAVDALAARGVDAAVPPDDGGPVLARRRAGRDGDARAGRLARRRLDAASGPRPGRRRA